LRDNPCLETMEGAEPATKREDAEQNVGGFTVSQSTLRMDPEIASRKTGDGSPLHLLPPEKETELRSCWKEGSELHVHYSKLGWKDGMITRIYKDADGEWIRVVAKAEGACKELSRNSRSLRPIVPKDLLGLAKQYTSSLEKKAIPNSPESALRTRKKETGKILKERKSSRKKLSEKSSTEEPPNKVTNGPKSPSPPGTPHGTARDKAMEGLTNKVQSGTVRELKTVEEKHSQFELVFALLHGLKHSVARAYSPEKITKSMCSDTEKQTFSHGPSGRGQPLPKHIKLRGFEFKVYAPRAFAQIRNMMAIDPQEFIISICFNKYVEFISNSKSGAFFYYSNDGKYMIKTIEKAEANCLTDMLYNYSNHLENNPESRLCKVYGLYRLSLNHSLKGMKGTKFYFIIMESVFYTAKFIHLIYDLKGSSYGRAATQKDINSRPTKNFTTTVLKDNDLRESKQMLNIGSHRAKEMKKQIESDAQFLANMGIIDYSLLIGIHYPLQPDPREKKAELERSETGEIPIWEKNSHRGRSPTIPIDTRAGYQSNMVNMEKETDAEEIKKVADKVQKSQTALQTFGAPTSPSGSKTKSVQRGSVALMLLQHWKY